MGCDARKKTLASTPHSSGLWSTPLIKYIYIYNPITNNFNFDKILIEEKSRFDSSVSGVYWQSNCFKFDPMRSYIIFYLPLLFLICGKIVYKINCYFEFKFSKEFNLFIKQ